MLYTVALYFNKATEKKANSIFSKISKEFGNKYRINNVNHLHLNILMFRYRKSNKTAKKIIETIDKEIINIKKTSIEKSFVGVFSPLGFSLQPIEENYIFGFDNKTIKKIDLIKNIILDEYSTENEWIPSIDLGIRNKNELINGLKKLKLKYEIMDIEINRIGLTEFYPYKEIKIWDV
jgi:thiol-disulfide isomerase/thioredoxin